MKNSTPELPFELPKSLASYLEQFENKPEKTIGRFKKQLKRRGPDAVGYFILGWFYYRQDKQDQAIDCALRAKTLAPGSTFFEKLHFYFSHPGLFNAKYISTPSVRSDSFDLTSGSNLDSLIQKLSQVESTPIKLKPEQDGNGDHEAYDTKEVDEIVSETLAKVHEQQGNTEEAIRIYHILKRVKKQRADFYDERIEILKELQSREDKK